MALFLSSGAHPTGATPTGAPHQWVGDLAVLRGGGELAGRVGGRLGSRSCSAPQARLSSSWARSLGFLPGFWASAGFYVALAGFWLGFCVDFGLDFGWILASA